VLGIFDPRPLVIVDVSGEHVEDYEAEMRIALSKQ